MTNIEKLKMLLKTNMSTKDIKEFLEVCLKEANDLRKKIESKYCKNISIPRSKIPTQFFIKEQKIDIEQIRNLAKIEKEFEVNK